MALKRCKTRSTSSKMAHDTDCVAVGHDVKITLQSAFHWLWLTRNPTNPAKSANKLAKPEPPGHRISSTPSESVLEKMHYDNVSCHRRLLQEQKLISTAIERWLLLVHSTTGCECYFFLARYRVACNHLQQPPDPIRGRCNGNS